MAEIKDPQKVLVITGVIFKNDLQINHVLDILSEELGKVSLCSDIIPFTHTTYYNKEMGEDLIRQWFAFERLVDPDILADLKHYSNKTEQRFVNEDARRRVNIDPGLITMSSLILASTKNYAHRIYIGKGIYAEVTLIFKNHEFISLEWTYPDYKETTALDFFLNTRELLKEKIKLLSLDEILE